MSPVLLEVRESLRRRYRFTRTETRITLAMLKTPDVNCLADALHVSLSTIRTHLRNLYSKTGTKTQVGFLHRICSDPKTGYMLPSANLPNESENEQEETAEDQEQEQEQDQETKKDDPENDGGAQE